MKKYLLVFFIPLLFASCEDTALDDITVHNSLDVAVKAAVTGSESEPPSSSVRTIEKGESADFPNVGGEVVYLYVKSELNDDGWYYIDLPPKLWYEIDWDDGYIVKYYK
jgi:hypothetical protein